MSSTGGADIAGGFDVEPVRGQPPHANRCPRLRWSGAEVLTNAANEVPIARKLPPIQHVRLRLTHAAVLAVAFGAEPESVTIAANPATAVDVHAIGAFGRLPLEL